MRIRTRSISALRTRSSMRARLLLTLPEEVILLILKFLSARDLTNSRLVCRRLKVLVDNSPSLWRTVSFPGIWPSQKNLHILERASNTGNIEASIKIGLAHLYNEGITDNKINSINNAQKNGKRAAEHFCKAERACVNGDPFIWFFVRPPWAPTGVCCKSCVFQNMVEICSVSQYTEQVKDSLQWLQKAADLGSSHAAYEIWKIKYATNRLEPSRMLQSVRELRDIASTGNLEAQLDLAMQYSTGNLGGASKDQVAEFITQDFPSQVVHIAVACVDQYIMSRKVQRSELQLLGITCILIAARFQGKDIVTIREAAWLTDNTYKYEDVVRMMGEVMACMRGQVRVLTIPDYLNLFSSLCAVDKTTDCLASYIADLSILHTEFGRFSPSVLSAACLVLANAIQRIEIPWPHHMPEMTGLKLTDFIDVIFLLHQKCLLDDSPIDHRNVKLRAIKERYASDSFMKVSELKIPNREALEQQNLKVKSSGDSLLDVSFGWLSESGYEGDLEDEGEEAMDESDFLGNDSMLNRQHSSFISTEEHSRSTSTPSILRQKPFFDDNVEDMDIEPVSILSNMIDSTNNVYAPVARQPLKQVENNLDQPYENKLMKPKSRRKECPLTRRRTRGKSVI